MKVFLWVAAITSTFCGLYGAVNYKFSYSNYAWALGLTICATAIAIGFTAFFKSLYDSYETTNRATADRVMTFLGIAGASACVLLTTMFLASNYDFSISFN